MSKPVHNFRQSKKTEIDNTFLHDQCYENYQKDLNQELKSNFVTKIDREICNYKTPLGKSYQQADTDAVVFFNCEETQNTLIKNISEKTRTKYYNDLYIEVMSIFKYNTQTKIYQFEAPGWGLKNEKLSPDCLSMLFLDNDNYTHFFIDDYKKLKESLFDTKLRKFLQSEEFEIWLNKKIKNDKNAGQQSFSLDTKGKSKNNADSVIFAKNNGYFTIGFTYSMEYIKTLVNVRKYEGSIVDQNVWFIPY